MNTLASAVTQLGVPALVFVSKSLNYLSSTTRIEQWTPHLFICYTVELLGQDLFERINWRNTQRQPDKMY